MAGFAEVFYNKLYASVSISMFCFVRFSCVIQLVLLVYEKNNQKYTRASSKKARVQVSIHKAFTVCEHRHNISNLVLETCLN